MIVYPAIDLRRGRCVRLQQGDAEAETIFADDPAAMARYWAAEGAEWLHLVNLDGALGEAGTENLAALERILAAVDLPTQFGGGVRSVEDVARLLGMGISRVILGTVAVRDPAIVEQALGQYGPERVCIGIDARDGYVAVHGWRETSTITAVDLARRMRDVGVRRVVYTDVRRDGMLSGVDTAGTVALAEATGLSLIASGGVASLDDIRELKAVEDKGIEGVIIGMALYRGAFQLSEALRIA